MVRTLYRGFNCIFALVMLGGLCSAEKSFSERTMRSEAERPVVHAGAESAKTIVPHLQKKDIVPLEVVQAANKGYPSISESVGEFVLKSWGVTSEALQSALLGEPFREYKITRKALRDYRKGDTVESLLSETDMWNFPVMIDRKEKLILKVSKMKNGASWGVVKFGRGPGLEFCKVLRDWPKSSGYTPIFIGTLHEIYLFSVPEKDAYNLTLIPSLPYMEEHTSYPLLDTVDIPVEWLKAAYKTEIASYQDKK